MGFTGYIISSDTFVTMVS